MKHTIGTTIKVTGCPNLSGIIIGINVVEPHKYDVEWRSYSDKTVWVNQWSDTDFRGDKGKVLTPPVTQLPEELFTL